MKISDYAVTLQGSSQRESYEKTIESRTVQTQQISVAIEEEAGQKPKNSADAKQQAQAFVLQLSDQARQAAKLQAVESKNSWEM